MNVRNNQLVQKGAVLMVIENSVKYPDVNKVVRLMETLQSQLKTITPLEINVNDSLQMGSLTPDFLAFLKSYNAYKLQLKISPQEKEIAIINKAGMSLSSFMECSKMIKP